MQNIDVLNIDDRIRICKKCPIYSPNRGICNPKLWLNPNTNEVSTVAKDGFYRGCGCNVYFRAKNPSNHCKLGKW